MWFKKEDPEHWERYDSLMMNMNAKIAELEERLKRDNNPKDTQERLAELEVKMSKLWALLTTTTPNGQDKLNKYGKLFGGKTRL